MLAISLTQTLILCMISMHFHSICASEQYVKRDASFDKRVIARRAIRKVKSSSPHEDAKARRHLSTKPPSTSTKSPSSSCADDPKVFSVNGDKRTCTWVGRTLTAKRCKDEVNAAHCPETCGLCGSSCTDHIGGYYVNGDKRTCTWVGRTNTVRRCNDEANAEHCPETCGLCGSSCADHIGGYYVNDQKRTCAWVARFNTEYRCGFSVHSEHCPVTCGTCS